MSLLKLKYTMKTKKKKKITNFARVDLKSMCAESFTINQKQILMKRRPKPAHGFL